ncbi:KaiA-binding protein [Halorubraceae archaeon YAN]|nr:KaiA-binding protein [Halorubraceae archaeon YAN]
MRIPSGVSGFDSLTDGGFPEGRLYILSGPPGSGKTTFSAQFLTKGYENGERGLYVSMHETRVGIIQDMSGYEFGFDRAMQDTRVHFLDALGSEGKRFFGSPGERVDRNSLVNRLVGFVESRGIDRVVVDSTMLLRYLMDDDENTVMRFLNALKRTDATTLLISEMTDPSAYSDEHFLAHGVIFFHNYLKDDQMRRGIQVVKMRGTPVNTDIHQFSFTPAGIVIEPETQAEK